MIHGSGVVLRPIEERDHPVITAWRNDPEVWWLLDLDGPSSLEEVAESELRAREEGHPFVIEVDSRAIGRIALTAFRRRDRLCSLSLLIGERDAWDRGHATDAVAALVDDAFDRFDLNRIEFATTADDPRPIEVCEACGFEEDARLPERSWRGGAWVDRIVLSVTREGFASSRASAALRSHRDA